MYYSHGWAGTARYRASFLVNRASLFEALDLHRRSAMPLSIAGWAEQSGNPATGTPFQVLHRKSSIPPRRYQAGYAAAQAANAQFLRDARQRATVPAWQHFSMPSTSTTENGKAIAPIR